MIRQQHEGDKKFSVIRMNFYDNRVFVWCAGISITFKRKGFKRRKRDVNLLGNTRGCGGREMNHFSIYYRSWKAERWKDKQNNLRSLKTEIYGCMHGSGATHQKCLTDDNGGSCEKQLPWRSLRNGSALFFQRSMTIMTWSYSRDDAELMLSWCIRNWHC